jgi:hypothetical protein
MQMIILDKQYSFNPGESQILKRGIIDPYDSSPNIDEWVVLDEYIFWSHRLMQPIVVPRWFITDLASIPRIFKPLISVNERHRLASIPHDLIYTLQALGQSTIKRKEADKVLSDFCKLQHVSNATRRMIYWAVRAGGWAVWGKTQKRMFAPITHRYWYRSQFSSSLDLDINAGEYLILK